MKCVSSILICTCSFGKEYINRCLIFYIFTSRCEISFTFFFFFEEYNASGIRTINVLFKTWLIQKEIYRWKTSLHKEKDDQISINSFFSLVSYCLDICINIFVCPCFIAFLLVDVETNTNNISMIRRIFFPIFLILFLTNDVQTTSSKYQKQIFHLRIRVSFSS